MDSMKTIAHATSMKEARRKQRHADGLLGEDAYDMYLLGRNITAANNDECVFPSWEGIEIIKLGYKYILVWADNDKVLVDPGELFQIDFRI